MHHHFNSIRDSSFVAQGLNVVSQEVVDIELRSGTADWRHLIEASMWPVPVVEMCPGIELFFSFCGVLVEPGIGPFTDSGLDKTFSFSIGAWGVDTGADMFEFEIAAGVAEAVGVEAWSVVGHHALYCDAQPCEVGHGLEQEAGRRDSLLVRH